MELRVCIDVDDLRRAVRFYTEALGLSVARRLGDDWAELAGAPVPIDLLAKAPGSRASPAAEAARDYRRHWTPVHLDVVVGDLEAALARALAAGATLEKGITEARWGRMANLADPFGHGLCLLQFVGRGYDEVLSPGAA
jgi:catechol 2,3-dioxygenase-like lactoylglutathione lyase family enzyme